MRIIWSKGSSKEDGERFGGMPNVSSSRSMCAMLRHCLASTLTCLTPKAAQSLRAATYAVHPGISFIYPLRPGRGTCAGRSHSAPVHALAWCMLGMHPLVVSDWKRQCQTWCLVHAHHADVASLVMCDTAQSTLTGGQHCVCI
jgi:hypothetical protein